MKALGFTSQQRILLLILCARILAKSELYCYSG